MSDILGHDIAGRPLRAGDRCVIMAAPALPEAVGRSVLVLGKCDVHKNSVYIDIPTSVLNPSSPYTWILDEALRRIDDRPETVTWEDMRDIWQPSEVTA